MKRINLQKYLTHTLSNIQKNLFSVSVLLKFDDDESIDFNRHKISVLINVCYTIQGGDYTNYNMETAPDFSHRVIEIYLSNYYAPKIISEVEMVFISDLKLISRQHHLEQPKSMLCRKLIRRFHESTSQDFEYKWLPDSFKDL